MDAHAEDLVVAAPLCAADGKGKNGMDIVGKCAVVPIPASASFDGTDCSPTLHKPNGTPGGSDQEIFAQKGAYLARCPASFVSGDRANCCDGGNVANTLPSTTGGFKPGAVATCLDMTHAAALPAEPGTHQQTYVFQKATHARTPDDCETYREAGQAQTLNCVSTGEARATELVVAPAVSKTLSAEGYDGMPDPVKGNGMQAVAIGFKGGQSAAGGLGDEPETAPTLSHQPSALEPTVAVAHKEGVCQQQTLGFKYKQSEKSRAPFAENGEAQALSSGCHDSAVAIKDLLAAMRHIVRRLTPSECEALQGFPRDWTRIPYRGKPAEECPDSPRYKALGNSWATNCAEWILRRIVAAFRHGMIEEHP